MRPRLSSLSKSEVKRRLVHVSGATVPLAYLLGVISWRQLTLLMVLFSAVVSVLEFLRLRVGLDWAIYDELTRSYEQTNLAGYALYVYSMTAVALVFEPYVAVPGMLMLAVGDPVSGLLGRTREADEFKQLGTLAAMFLVCLAVSAPVLYPVAGVGGLLAAVAGSAGATVADGMKPVVRGYVIDDNASIPPAACLAIAAVLWVVGVSAV
ncbi:diacylglycerol/polyprenol kinase family protein [Halogeometricum luteum]|uniref:Dolichol kinase n=1 Tax=Halogeometricum luteum TaxID=2950537 RepID=A0ABU2G5F1_9EURY|nr:dolichol kinase [Halogeometricum sp. S3BR5-2]MDS0296020.1 dolichol kinase [Halogeometricum sp. S3BR5-2]